MVYASIYFKHNVFRSRMSLIVNKAMTFLKQNVYVSKETKLKWDLHIVACQLVKHSEDLI